MNLKNLLDEFLQENYKDLLDEYFNRRAGEWFTLRAPDETKLNIELADDGIKFWSFKSHVSMGSLAGYLYIEDPEFFSKMSNIISKHMGVEPTCQPSKMTILAR